MTSTTCPLAGLIQNCTFFAAGDSWQKSAAEPSTLSRPAVAAAVNEDDDTEDDSTTTISINGVVARSVSMSERKQRDVTGTFYCGARTLFVAASDCRSVLLRGANKFFDLPAAFTHTTRSFMSVSTPSSSSSFSCCPSKHLSSVLALRKAAGFFCMFFPESVQQDSKKKSLLLLLRCSSKHSLSGPHVQAAESAMQQHLRGTGAADEGEEEEGSKLLLRLATRLQQMDAVLLCECIGGDTSKLGAHPVDDSDLQQSGGQAQLICFALQKRSTVVEWSYPHSTLVSFAQEFGIPVVPQVQLSSNQQQHSTGVGDIVFELVQRASETALLPAPASTSVLRGEGAVLLLETNSQQQQQQQQQQQDSLTRPIRLKIKTAQYQVVRQLRGLLVDGSVSSNLFPLAAAMGLWLKQQQQQSISNTEYPLSSPVVDATTNLPRGFRSWEDVMDQFQQQQQQGSSSTTALQRLDHDACLRHRAALLCPRIIILLCGLPATGKSALTRALSAKLLAMQNSIDQVHVIERDSFVPDIPAGSSAHAQRAARRSAHRGFFRALRNPSDFAPRAGLQVVVADACHASAGARATTRECCAPYRRGATVFLACDDRKLLVKRIMKRTGHAVLGGGGAVAEKAIFDVASSMEVPVQGESENDVLLRFDVGATTMTAEAMADRIISDVVLPELELFRSDFSKSSPTSSMSNDQLADEECWRLCNSIGSAAAASSSSSPICSSVKELVARCCPPQRRITTVRLIAASTAEGDDDDGDSRSWLHLLGPSIQATLRNCDASVVVAGHTKWVRPYFLQQQQQQQQQNSPDNILDSLLQKLNLRPSPLHVTIRHVGDFPAGGGIPDVEQWLAAESNNNGQLFSIQPTHLLLDRRVLAVQVRVRPVPISADEGASSDDAAVVAWTSGTFFHITLAHSEKVPPSHVLSRFGPAIVAEGGERRRRDDDDDDEDDGNDDSETKKQPLSGRQKKKVKGDMQFCVLPLVAPVAKDADHNAGDGDAAMVSSRIPELFGVVECL